MTKVIGGHHVWLSMYIYSPHTCINDVTATQFAACAPVSHLRASVLSSLYYVKLIRRWKRRRRWALTGRHHSPTNKKASLKQLLCHSVSPAGCTSRYCLGTIIPATPLDVDAASGNFFRHSRREKGQATAFHQGWSDGGKETFSPSWGKFGGAAFIKDEEPIKMPMLEIFPLPSDCGSSSSLEMMRRGAAMEISRSKMDEWWELWPLVPAKVTTHYLTIQVLWRYINGKCKCWV